MSGFFEPRSALFYETTTNCSEWRAQTSNDTPRWSPVKVRIVSYAETARVQDAVNELLADEAISVVGISPAMLGTQGDEYGQRWPEYVITVLYQERINLS